MKPSVGIVAAVLGVAAMAAGTAVAQAPSDDELRAIASCREIPKSKDRLRCFERTTEILQPYAPFAAAPAKEDTETVVASGEAENKGAVGAAPSAPAFEDEENAAASAVASFGAEDLIQEDEEKQIKELRTIAVTITQNKRGKYIVTLENGQVWRQLQSDSNKLRVRKDKEGDGHEIIIKKRALGSYALRMATAKRSILVRRIK